MRSLITKTAGFAVCMLLSLPSFGQTNYYVVVSAISTDGDVKEFTAHLPSFNADTAYALTDEQSTLKFYVWRTTSKEMALSKTIQLQENLEASAASVAGDYETMTLSNLPNEKKITYTTNSKGDFSLTKPAEEFYKPSITVHSSDIIAPANMRDHLYKFTITNEQGIPLQASIHEVDFTSERELGTYEANISTSLVKAKDSELTLSCGIFGYKLTEKYFDYENPSQIEGAYQDEKGIWVIPYTLQRLEKGDVSIMYNLAFHKDAVVMMAQSKSELDELVNMMEENPNYEITIHGHCNGRNHRKIIAMGAEQQFFDINGSQEIYGSAKMLSDLRCQAVKMYLTEHGIDARRIKTFEWGGSYMLVKQHSTESKLNDRIEIEIRKN